MEIYLWTEDSKSGFEFWKILVDTLYPHIGITVETKNNYIELANAVENISDNSQNIYLIAMDNIYDNPNVNQTYSELEDTIEDKNNIYLIDMISFEYIFLDFKNLLDWVFSINIGDKLYDDRKDWVEVREAFLQSVNRSYKTKSKDSVNYKNLKILEDNMKKLKSYTVESCATKILKELTRNTGFAIDKASRNKDEHFGYCYKNDCKYNTDDKECSYSIYKKGLSTQDTKAENCGLRYIENIDNLWEKMADIFQTSQFHNQFISILGNTCSKQEYLAAKEKNAM